MDEMEKEEKKFILNSQDNAFKSRVNDIFGALPTLKTSSATEEEKGKKHDDTETDRYRHSSDTSFSHRKYGNEVRTNHPPLRNYPHDERRRYQQRKRPAEHPEKYTKYSLKDDGSAKIKGLHGDALNKKIALDFINDLKGQKKNDTESPEKVQTSLGDFKPRFKSNISKQDNEKNEVKGKPTFQSSHGAKATVMKTFEFGEKQTKKKNENVKTTNNAQTSQVALRYYEDEGDVEET